MTLDHLENYLKVFEEINKSSVINGKPDLQCGFFKKVTTEKNK